MFMNNRDKPHELHFFDALVKRSVLTGYEKSKYAAIIKGYEGECLYDKILDEIGHRNIFIYRNLTLKIGETITQYDTLIITDDGVIVNEIKNYSGLYKYLDGFWYNKTNSVPDDPISQINRATGKIIRVRNSVQYKFKVLNRIIFINDDLILETDNEKLWDKIVTRNDLRRYFRSFNSSTAGRKAEYIARLLTNYIAENPYLKGIEDNSRLRKGLYCGQCHGFNLIKNRYHLNCSDCGSKETNETHLLRALSDYKFLYFNQPMTMKSFMEFIDYKIKYNVIYRILLKHCYVENRGNKTNYVFKYYDFDEALKMPELFIRYKDYLLVDN